MLYCLHQSILCIDSKGNQVNIQGIPKKVSVRKIFALQAKKCIRKGCKLFAVNIQDIEAEREQHIKEFLVLVDFKDIFPKEIPRLPKITTEMRLRFFHRINPRISSSFKIPLPHERTRVGGTQTAVVGVNRGRVYPTQCVSLGSTDIIHKK